MDCPFQIHIVRTCKNNRLGILDLTPSLTNTLTSNRLPATESNPIARCRAMNRCSEKIHKWG